MLVKPLRKEYYTTTKFDFDNIYTVKGKEREKTMG
jgi:hypothetical protein